MARSLPWVAGCALAVVIAGLPLFALERAPVTRFLAREYFSAQETGLDATTALSLAEKVRAFVVDGDGELPERVGSRAAFDQEAVAHLIDVRNVLRGARAATGGALVLFLAWAAWALVRRDSDAFARSLRVGGATVAVGAMVGVVIALADFDTFFSAFHGVFFEAGSWVFPADSLLIQLFPEPLWASLGALWAGGLVTLAAGCWVAGGAMRHKRLGQKA